jgi:predicted ATPase
VIDPALLRSRHLIRWNGSIATMVAFFDRVVASGTPELVLVSGYSGIGKSSVVNELHKVLVPPRGLFASGKFDQYKRDIPYSTLAQAFQGYGTFLLQRTGRQWRRHRACSRQLFEKLLSMRSQIELHAPGRFILLD